jgi:uncharacterized protein YbaP (TraB family)
MNHITLKIAVLFVCIGLSVNLSAQNKSADKKNYALLWEITGNGLTKPSYLFGTMHIRDKRVFEFSDSMLLKLESCDAFATEVRMDSAVYQGWETAVAGDTTNKLSRKLSKTGYERLLKALRLKGINLDSLESKNTTLVHDWLTEREDTDDKDDSKDLFLDLYLTRLAYTQGKTLHGLERMEDYQDLNDSYFQQFEDSSFYQKDTAFTSLFAHFAFLEEMINVYNSGDLDKMLGIIQSEKAFNGKQHKREMLDNRNVRMLQRMEELMQQKSVFCAVGTAHLPDSMGLLALLRQKGYSLRRVTPQFTGMAEQYKPQKVDREWYHLKDDFNHIELDFPEQPYLMNKLNANSRRLGVQNLYYDIITGSILMSEVDFFPHLGQKKQTKEQLLNDVFTNWTLGRDLKNIQREQITIGEYIGFKFTARLKSKALVKGRFVVANNNIYKTIAFFDKHNESNPERADKFLESIKINPLPLTDWQTFEDEKAAFSIRMPVKPDFQEIKTSVPMGDGEAVNYYVNLFVSKEAKEGYTYIVRYSDMPSGRFVQDDSFYMAQIRAESVDKFRKLKAKVEIDSVTRHYGCPEYTLKVSADGFTMFMRNILRGNRLYFVLGQPPMATSKAGIKKLEDWVNSFQFLPFSPPKLTKKEFPDMGLSIGLPTSFEPYLKKEENGRFPIKKENVIHTSDSHSSTACVITRTTFSKYYSAINPDSLWAKYARDLTSNASENVKSTLKDTVFKGLNAKILTLNYLQTQNVFKSVVFIKDGYQYEYSLVLPYETVTDVYANTYFDAVEILDNKEKHDIYSSKKQLIINDLDSDIDSIQIEAKKALAQTDWVKADLPLLTKAIQKSYSDDTLKYGSVRIQLLNQILEFKDTSTFSLLDNLIQTTAKDSTLHKSILCALLTLDTLESSNKFFDIAQKMGKFEFDKFYCLSDFMTDSVARAQLYYDKMLALSDKPFEIDNVISISASLAAIDTLKLMRATFQKYTPQYLATANGLISRNDNLLRKDTVAKDEYPDYYLLENYIYLLGELQNTAEINQFLMKIQSSNQPYLLKATVESLLKNKQSVENSTWQKLSKDKLNWYHLLNNLKDDSLLNKVPPQYINAKDIAEGSLRSYLTDDYGELKEVTLLNTQKYKGELLYIFSCKMDFGDDENKYIIAVCGQPTDKTKYNLSPKIELISEAMPDTKSYKKVVEQLLKDYEKSKQEN